MAVSPQMRETAGFAPLLNDIASQMMGEDPLQAEIKKLLGDPGLAKYGGSPDKAMKSLAEANRMSLGGIPRDQLEKLKENLKSKIPEFIEAAQAKRFANLPIHLQEAKDVLAYSVQESDLKSEAFDPANLGKTIQQMHDDDGHQASVMMTQLIDTMTAELTPIDQAEVMDALDATVDEHGGAQVTAPAQKGLYDPMTGVKTLQTTGYQDELTGKAFDMDGAPIDPMELSHEQAASAMVTGGRVNAALPGGEYEGTGHEPRQDPYAETQANLTPQEQQSALKMIFDHLNKEPQQQIAEFEDPSPLMWFGAVLAAVLFPDIRPQLLALPWMSQLQDQQRRQEIFDTKFKTDNDRWARTLSFYQQMWTVEENAKEKQLDRDNATSIADRRDTIEAAKILNGIEGDNLKRFDGLDKELNDMLNEGQPAEAIQKKIDEINAFSKDPKHPIYTPEASGALVKAGSGRYEAKSRLQGTKADAAALKLETDKAIQQFVIDSAKEGLDGKKLDNELKRFNVANAPADLALEWAKDIKQLQQIDVNIAAKLKEDQRADIRLELDKLTRMEGSTAKIKDIMLSRQTQLAKKSSDLAVQKAIALQGGNSVEAASLQTQIDSLNDEQTSLKVALEGTDGKGGITGFFNEIQTKAQGLGAASGGIAVPHLDVPGVINPNLPKGVQGSDKITETTNSGKFSIGPGYTVDLGQVFDYGSKGKDGKTDCSGLICEAVKSNPDPSLKTFPQGTIDQIGWIEKQMKTDKRWSNVTGDWGTKYEAWAKKAKVYNQWASLPQGQRVMQPEPPNPGDQPSLNKELLPGDIVYFQRPITGQGDSGMHAMMVANFKKDGTPIFVEAKSSKVPTKEQVAANAYNLDDDFWKRNENGMATVVLRFSPGKVK